MNTECRSKLASIAQKLRDVDDSDFDWAARIVEAYANGMIVRPDEKWDGSYVESGLYQSITDDEEK